MTDHHRIGLDGELVFVRAESCPGLVVFRLAFDGRWYGLAWKGDGWAEELMDGAEALFRTSPHTYRETLRYLRKEWPASRVEAFNRAEV